MKEGPLRERGISTFCLSCTPMLFSLEKSVNAAQGIQEQEYIYLMIQPTMNSSALDPHAFIFVHLKRLNGDQ